MHKTIPNQTMYATMTDESDEHWTDWLVVDKMIHSGVPDPSH